MKSTIIKIKHKCHVKQYNKWQHTISTLNTDKGTQHSNTTKDT